MREFHLNEKHPDIALVQTALDRAGYSPGEIDGIFGILTLSALNQFRFARNLPAERGRIAESDWRALTPFLVGYVTHTVKRGDTLFALAKQNKTSVRAIETANPTIQLENLPIGQTLTIPLDFPVVATNIPFTATALHFAIHGLVVRYPQIKRQQIGQSVLGAPIDVLIFGEGEQQISYNASHHGNEWITTPVLLKFLEQYANAVASSGKIGDLEALALFETSTLHLIPMVNPDGVDVAAGWLDRGAFYDFAKQLAADYPHFPFPDGWKANIRGVDLNLQYPASWEKAREIKFAQGFTRPGPRDYVGSAVLSEPESRALYDYTMENDFVLTMSYHSQGKVIYWQYLDFLPPNSREIGEIFAELSGYPLEETPFASGHAGYKDWFIQQFDRPAYTIEVGIGQSPLPLEQFDEIYRDNVRMLAAGLDVLV